ncbi:MAG: protein kinase [Gemmatimonadales bacterium]
MPDEPNAEFLAVQGALAGRYVLEREIGRGGMATVFLARDVAHDRPVALKVLRSELEGDAGEARFLREIKLLANLQHPNIVSLHDSGILEAGGGPRLPFFTMPYVDGESLRKRMSSDRALTRSESVRIVREIADALAGAHAAGTVHRDLKPENVLLSQGHAMVSDFGIAKAKSGDADSGYVTTTGLILGTPAYMAPEQALGGVEMDHRADLYSLGVIAYELLAGRPLFGARTPQQMLVAHAVEAPEPILKYAPDLDPAVAKLVMRLLAKRPEDRPQAAAEVVAALDATGTRDTTRPLAARRVATVLLALGVLATFGVLAGWIASRSRGTRGVPLADAALGASVAVLPFDNLSGDAQKEYFSDGMTEQIMFALGKVAGLRVSPRTSAFAFRGRGAALREIGSQLHVAHVLEGSVRQAGSRLRVNVRLVNVASGDALWSDEYERNMSDVFQVQDDIARAIVGALRVRLTGDAATSPAGAGTQNVKAYDLYLQGRYFYERRTEQDFLRALSLFEQAIRADPSYARAYAGMSSTYTLLGVFGYRKPAALIPLAKDAAAKAIRLDSTSTEAYTSLGIVRLLLEWDWEGARQALERAISLDARYVPARLFHAWYYVVASRTDEAVREMRLGAEIDPLSKIMNTRLGTMLQAAHRDSEAVAAYQRTLALDSTDVFANSEIAESWVALHRCDMALHAIGHLAAEVGTVAGEPIGFVLVSCGRESEARAMAANLERRSATSAIAPEAMVSVYAALGQKDKALGWLERAYADRQGSLFQMRIDPAFASLRSEPRFAAIVQRMHFP